MGAIGCSARETADKAPDLRNKTLRLRCAVVWAQSPLFQALQGFLHTHKDEINRSR